ncbi:hypothetical protein BUALT_Bualt01G0116200 [Buddleja alternifolia]|uniref:Uncharacterized protein n=1 Tax=Buddleja alternifolia TaxID=168488 RepID=A0AAV6YEX7_9LAMI|nr:hypothetical protein BUALT_Bualt01G0116200 [Buddleja alternifolia]
MRNFVSGILWCVFLVVLFTSCTLHEGYALEAEMVPLVEAEKMMMMVNESRRKLGPLDSALSLPRLVIASDAISN